MQLLTTRNSNTQNPLQDLRYTYDPVGNIVEIYDASKETSYYKNSVIEPRHLFTYDALYRLLSGTGRELLGLAQATSGGYAANSAGAADAKALHTYTQNFAYDELGNIKSIQHTTLTSTLNWTRNYVYDDATNRLLKHDKDQTLPDYTYDEHGNITKMPHLQSMHYDYKDQLNKVVLDASENMAYYVYDANGQRVRKVIEKTGGIKEERYYLGNYEVYRKFVGITLETERTTVAVADDKRKIATIDKLTVEKRSLINLPVAVIRYQYDNHLGSASLELDATAQIISYEEYHPFGSTSYRSGRSETEVSQKRYKYVGKERDEETGLYYYGFRYYAPWIARFINVDPLQHEYPHYTPFQYAGNKPVTYVDLDGLEEDPAPANNEFPTKPKHGQVHIILSDGKISFYKYNSKNNDWAPDGMTINLDEVTIKPEKRSIWRRIGDFIRPIVKKLGDLVNKTCRFLSRDFGGSGETIPGGIYIVTDGDPSSTTRTKSENPNDAKKMNGDKLFLLLGNATAGPFVRPSLPIPEALSKLTDIAQETPRINITSDKDIVKSKAGESNNRNELKNDTTNNSNNKTRLEERDTTRFDGNNMLISEGDSLWHEKWDEFGDTIRSKKELNAEGRSNQYRKNFKH